MPQLSEEAQDDRQSSAFTPTLLDNYDSMIREMNVLDNEEDEEALKAIKELEKAVVNRNVDAGIAAISGIYGDKLLLVKTLLETAMKYMPPNKALVTNYVFHTTNESMLALDVVLCVKVLCQTNKGKYVYTPYPEEDKTIEQMIQEAGDKCNNDYLKLEYCDRIYWSYPNFLRALAKDGAGTTFKEVITTSTDKGKASLLERRG